MSDEQAAPDEQTAPDPEAELRGRLAHDQWANAMRAAGWRWGPELDLPGLRHPQVVAWEQLTDEARADYVADAS